jgi:5,10-methylene-tetrahydrofolate dehydrogenase/methenyl tetrahydrofolate cyclohydrolase
MKLIASPRESIAGKHAVVISRSNTVSKPMAAWAR